MACTSHDIDAKYTRSAVQDVLVTYQSSSRLVLEVLEDLDLARVAENANIGVVEHVCIEAHQRDEALLNVGTALAGGIVGIELAVMPE